MLKANRRSGLQGDVLSLFRSILRVAKTKDNDGATMAYARAKFRADAFAITRMDFAKIEFNLRQGHKKLKLLRMPGTMGVASSSSPSPSLPSSPPTGGKRAFSTRAFSMASDSGSVLAYDSPERPRVHVVSLGCGRNWVDSEVMLGSFLKAGYEIEVNDPSKATLLVVNTCGFLGAARDEADREIQRLIAAKAGRHVQGLAASLVVTGCMVNLEKEAVLVRHPAIDHLVGAAGIGKVLHAVTSGQRLLAIPMTPREQRATHGEAVAALATATATGERSISKSHLEGDDDDDEAPEVVEPWAEELAEAAAAARLSLAVGEPPLTTMPLIGGRVLATPPHTAYLKVCMRRPLTWVDEACFLPSPPSLASVACAFHLTDRRGLPQEVHLLHHPADQGPAPQQAGDPGKRPAKPLEACAGMR
jgi:hypothetical protein